MSFFNKNVEGKLEKFSQIEARLVHPKETQQPMNPGKVICKITVVTI